MTEAWSSLALGQQMKPLEPKKWKVNGEYRWVVDGKINGRRRREQFDTKKQAESFIMSVEKEPAVTAWWSELTMLERVDLHAAFKIAKEEGFRIISLEDVGQKTPWDTDLTGDTMIVVGGERNGIPKSILDISDEIIRVPMSGFVPSFNLQAPLSVVAVEAQRQRSN